MTCSFFRLPSSPVPNDIEDELESAVTVESMDSTYHLPRQELRSPYIALLKAVRTFFYGDSWLSSHRCAHTEIVENDGMKKKTDRSRLHSRRPSALQLTYSAQLTAGIVQSLYTSADHKVSKTPKDEYHLVSLLVETPMALSTWRCGTGHRQTRKIKQLVPTTAISAVPTAINNSVWSVKHSMMPYAFESVQCLPVRSFSAVS